MGDRLRCAKLEKIFISNLIKLFSLHVFANAIHRCAMYILVEIKLVEILRELAESKPKTAL